MANRKRNKTVLKEVKKLNINEEFRNIIIASDIGTTGSPSEVGIFFGDENGKWRYEYQISLFKLTTKEQGHVFEWLYRFWDYKKGATFVSYNNELKKK